MSDMTSLLVVDLQKSIGYAEVIVRIALLVIIFVHIAAVITLLFGVFIKINKK